MTWEVRAEMRSAERGSRGTGVGLIGYFGGVIYGKTFAQSIYEPKHKNNRTRFPMSKIINNGPTN